MKRTEAVEKLQERLENLFGENSPTSPNFSTLSNNLLKFLEDLGMTPPCQSSHMCQIIMSVYIDGDFNKWDEELEKDERIQKRIKRLKGKA